MTALTATPAVEARGLTKRYGTRIAVDDLSLAIQPGEIYGLLGANGAGKTTTILMLMGILSPDAGEVRIRGRPMGRSSLGVRRQVGAVSEHSYLYSDMTVLGYLQFFASYYGLQQPAARIGAMLELTGLGGRTMDRTVDLSKGLQQKLSLARALLHDPPVLILDEPASGLDPHGIREFRELLMHERARGRSILLSSHILSEIERTADRVGILHAGRLLAEGTTAMITRRADERVELLVELDAPGEHLLPALRDVPGVLAVRAEAAQLHLHVAEGATGRRQIGRALAAGGAVVLRMEERAPSLEDAFITLTDQRVEEIVSGADDLRR